MPTYEYECDSCGYHFEAVQKMTEAPLHECPQCKKNVHRLISGGLGVSFKGSGFYVTDSAAACPAQKTDGKAGPAAACANCACAKAT